jgi:hypothetical protein
MFGVYVDPLESSGDAAALRREFGDYFTTETVLPWSGIEFAHAPLWWYGQPLGMVRYWPDGYTASAPDGATILPLTDDEMEPVDCTPAPAARDDEFRCGCGCDPAKPI